MASSRLPSSKSRLSFCTWIQSLLLDTRSDTRSDMRAAAAFAVGVQPPLGLSNAPQWHCSTPAPTEATEAPAATRDAPSRATSAGLANAPDWMESS